MVFFDWQAGITFNVAFKSMYPDLHAAFAKDTITIKPDETFVVHFKLKNLGQKVSTGTISHHVEPEFLKDNLQMIQCRLLSPLYIAIISREAFRRTGGLKGILFSCPAQQATIGM